MDSSREVTTTICVYPPDCTDFSTNGNGVIEPITAEVTETLNGEYELQLEHPIDPEGKWQRLIEGCIVRAPVPAAMTPAVEYCSVALSGSGQEIWRIHTDFPEAETPGGTLRLRNGPGNGYPVLATYKNRSLVQILNKTNASWYECTAPDGKHGWFATKYLVFDHSEGSSEAAADSVVEPRQLRDQPFRIYRVVPELTKVTVYARHIFYDLLDNMIRSIKPSSSMTGASVVQTVSSSCLSDHGFTFYSDLDSTAEEVELENMNPVDAFLGSDAQASGLSMTELQDEKYRQQLSGSVLVARSVTAEQIAAATITANEILSGTITGDKIAAATIEGSNIKAGSITTSHVSSDFGSTLDLSSNVGINQMVSRVYSDMDDLIGYRIEIVSTSDVLSDSIQSTTLTARVWHGSENVTDALPASRFQWKRKSADDTADAIWNAAHIGMKSIMLNTRDVYFSATYDCELVKEDT